MTQCDRCGLPSLFNVRYSGARLCNEHFCEFVEKRVRAEVKRQGRLPKGSTLALAISGGKDSMVMLHILHSIFERHRGIDLVALSVDEGIEGYRSEALRRAHTQCKELEIPAQSMSFKEAFGITMDEIAGKESQAGPCTYCGVLRRSLLNRSARESGARRLALGHNLDDMAQSILMNIVNGDVQRLVRLAPHSKVQMGLVPRILPLRTLPEEETKLYAELKGIPYLDRHCPYRSKAHRLGFLKIIRRLERETPGTRQSILSSYDQMIVALRAHFPQAKLNACAKCGEPAMGETCKACELLEAFHST